jgi:hypothetical protein
LWEAGENEGNQQSVEDGEKKMNIIELFAKS